MRLHGHERPDLEPSKDHPVHGGTGTGSNTTVVEESVDEQINELAQRITSPSLARGSSAILPEPSDSRLDPKSPDFDSKTWTKVFYDTQMQALGGTPPNTAGLAFRNLNVFGKSEVSNYQKTVGGLLYGAMDLAARLLGQKQPQRVDILQDLEGVLNSGEMLCVLGPPGSGCSTLLKTVAGETFGFQVDKNCMLNYQGLTAEDIRTSYRGEAIYTAEVDHHFPRLTVGETLYFAARARCPRRLMQHKHEYAEHIRDVIMAMLGIAHTKNTRVGNDYIRGVSGGERKRVSIAEAVLSYSPWQCWDNSTRGLDSANAIEFCRTLRLQSEVFGNTVLVAIYQAPQEAYNVSSSISSRPSSQANKQLRLNSCLTRSSFSMKAARSSLARRRRRRHILRDWASSAPSSRRPPTF
jgi:ABC-type multidrug transport system ATPase subunit